MTNDLLILKSLIINSSEKEDFNHCLDYAEPKYWSKYTRLRLGYNNVILLQIELYHQTHFSGSIGLSFGWKSFGVIYLVDVNVIFFDLVELMNLSELK